ncbi:hypothetical protein OSB04_008937 [Centaurea solstitialis]|uniref:Uncharacterized protein n=1 Tax=Centaurea solstitialis TaxID=347529 RepID=A0AA38WJX5_9ASTR|nr:hypothetical protein OSB04_008937 [Centaurea solstitialis]
MADTTDLSYWLNWRFFLCALWVLIIMIAAGLLIVKYEVVNKKRSRQRDDDEADVEPIGILYEDETWRTSLRAMHPGWLLAYRLIAFSVLLALLVTNLAFSGTRGLLFYTQWTFALVTFYFGLASSLSIYGCCQYSNEVGDANINHVGLDTEQGTVTAPLIEHSLAPQHVSTKPSNHGEINVRKTAGMWGYFFQIVFQALFDKFLLTISISFAVKQICAGSVGLTDTVFWLIIYPFLTPSTYKLTFLRVCLHSVNAVFLLIEVILNRLRFPFFRLAYFALWTCTFVIFHWILHACVSMWWPYPFLDLSSPYAPIWYFGVGLIHLPAFGIFALIVKWKQLLLSRFSENIGS